MEKLPQEGKKIQQHPDASNEQVDFRLCLVLSHLQGPIGYSIFTFDSSDSRVVVHGNQLPKLTPLIELPSEVYPKGSGVFVVGSRVYLVGGEIEARPKRSGKPLVLTNSVYVIDTAAPISLGDVMQHSTHMNGGKSMSTVDYVNGLVYVLSGLPTFNAYFDKKNVFFESFDPNTDEWSPLPNPPFFDFKGGRARIDSHVVVGSTIVYRSYAFGYVYVFHLETNKWEIIEMSREQWALLPFRNEFVLLKDAVWASIGVYALSTYCLVPELGFVQRQVDSLGMLVPPCPQLQCMVGHILLRLNNDWFCMVAFGHDGDSDIGGKPFIRASVFRLVQTREDEFSLCEAFPWPPHRTSPSAATTVPKPGKKPRKAVREVPVFGAVDIFSILFDVDVKHFNEWSALAGCFLLGT